MREVRAHCADLREGDVRLSAPVAHHLLRVLRLGLGAPVTLFDGAGLEAQARLERIDGEALWVRVEPPALVASTPRRRVHLAIALLKGDKLSDVVRMGTELGVASFQPLLAARCDVKELSASKAQRLARIAAEAARQSGRADIPTLHPLQRLSDWQPATPLWFAHPAAEERFDAASAPPELTLLSGPEGGWSEGEVAHLAALGARSVGLGAGILRAETAPVAMAAALMLAGVA